MNTSAITNTSTPVDKEYSEVKPLFFHIGWMRTGTTFLQGLFRQGKDINLSLKNRFFSYDPFYNRGVEYYQQQVLHADSAVKDHLIYVDSDENYSMGRFKTQLREAGDIAYNHRSELNFICHDVQQMVNRMKASAPDAKIFGVIRKQPGWFESVYKHDVYHFGLDQPFSAFYESKLGKDYRMAADYYAVYKIFEAAFHKENIKIMLFDDFVKNQTLFMQEMSDFFGVNLQVSDERSLKKNASTSNFFTLLHRQANRLCEKNPSAAESALYKTARKTVAKLDRLSGKLNLNLDAEIITADMKRQIIKQYADGNKKLAAELGLEDKMRDYGYF